MRFSPICKDKPAHRQTPWNLCAILNKGGVCKHDSRARQAWAVEERTRREKARTKGIAFFKADTQTDCLRYMFAASTGDLGQIPIAGLPVDTNCWSLTKGRGCVRRDSYMV